MFSPVNGTTRLYAIPPLGYDWIGHAVLIECDKGQVRTGGQTPVDRLSYIL